jgi:NADH:ubiquinone oxidoreductase subunit K
MIESSSQPTLTHHSNFKMALLSLPGQYLKVLIHPSVNTFVYEKSRGSWGLVWFQLFMLSGISALLAVLASLLAPPDVNAIATSSGIPPQTLHIILLLTPGILTFLLTPISFLLSTALLYFIIRLCGGRGTYLQQIFVTLLFGVPLVLLSAFLSLIPTTSNWLPWLPHIYSILLLILALIAVHYRKEVH